ncbi:hypothetical protein [Streptacidiphilus monticola]|uniref:Uncharacterized protein n=1 Tax=Streptacidiphilus monticola TaxID=2161674 RepID=A0ABW1GBW1_9ACTN
MTVSEHGRDSWSGSTATYVQYAHPVRAGRGAAWRVSEMRGAQ